MGLGGTTETLHARLQETPRDVADEGLRGEAESARARYRASLDNDLNLPQGMGHVFDVVRTANAALDRGRVGEGSQLALLRLLDEADAHLDVLRADDEGLEPRLQAMIDARERARAQRDFATADRLRESLREHGVLLEDSKSGVRWRRS